MWIIGLIIGGLIIGAIARLIVPGRNPIGILMTIGLGVVGSLVGGLVAHAIGAGALIAFIVGVIVAAILVALVSGSRTRRAGII
ncbi:MAG TPA: GlsB/YeaQ/YmgE family stress response membrane protein [Mycobacteriales bacterium]|nr:GlsB/YeaQ/YmgE family stress response membrane protein [Mycobacteriales bacterium]